MLIRTSTGPRCFSTRVTMWAGALGSRRFAVSASVGVLCFSLISRSTCSRD